MEIQVATKRRAGGVLNFKAFLDELDKLSEKIFIMPRNSAFEKKLADSVKGRIVFNPPYRVHYLITYGSDGVGMLVLDPKGVPIKEIEVGRPWHAGILYVGTGEGAPAGKIFTFTELVDFFLRHGVAELVEHGKAECEGEALRDFILTVRVNAKTALSRGGYRLLDPKNVYYSIAWRGWRYVIRWGEMYVGISKESAERVHVVFLDGHILSEELAFTLKKKNFRTEYRLKISEFVKTPAYRALTSTLPVAERIAELRAKTFLLSYLGVRMHAL